MTEKFINIGVFWMPLIAGIILGGMSPSVWYGGDKIAALWMTFVGVALLLLTATFQLQSYIQGTILQPQFDVSAPADKSILTWNPPADSSLNIKGENDNLQPGGWRVPTFAVKNSAPINAQDVRVAWSATRYDPATLTNNAAIMQGRQVSIANDLITLSAPGGVPFQNPFRFTAATDKPFITKSAEIFIPLDVWNTAALYFLVNLTGPAGTRSEPYFFDLQISWNIPDNAKPLKYRVKAVATKLAAPVFQASVEFSVEQAE